MSEWGHAVIVAHARKVRLIGESSRKDDQLDARTLARLARIDPDLLGAVRHRSARAQIHLTVIRARAALVSTRTALVNAARGFLAGLERAYLDGLVEVAARRRVGDSLLVLFLGSTIGNFDRPAGESFLSQVRQVLQPGDALLLATDLKKLVPQLLQADDDPTGVTAAFNLNLLARINRELDADFDLAKFRHVACWNESERRIEMRLHCQAAHRVTIPAAGCRVSFERFETIWTESSHKYNTAEVIDLALRTGYSCDAQWIDHEWPFAHSLFVAS